MGLLFVGYGRCVVILHIDFVILVSCELQAYVRSIIIVLMCGEFVVGVKAMLVPREGCSSAVEVWSK